MKTFLTKLSSSFILLSLTMTALARPVALVTEVKGTVVVIAADGRPSTLKVNEHLNEHSEILLEEDATITLNDYYNATYHLLGGTHLKLFDKSVQLKKGKAWIQSASNRHLLGVTTANGYVAFKKGEFIASYDQQTSKSQVLAIAGDIDVSNILDKNYKYQVSAGSFTTIDPDVDNGSPRAPTKVGLASLDSALAEFKQLPGATKEAPGRSIASVDDVKKGEIIFIKSSRMPASVLPQKPAVRKFTPPKTVPIKIYGTKWQENKPQRENRSPASIVPLMKIRPKKAEILVNKDQEFETSLKRHAQDQPKFSKELENLIHDLNSFD